MAAVVSRCGYVMHNVCALALAWCMFHVKGVPCPDNCICAPSLKVTWSLTKLKHYTALPALDPRTEALTCSVAKSFNKTAGKFGHSYDLKTLLLKSSKKYSNVQSDERDGTMSHFLYRNLFHNFSRLSYFGINVVIISFDPVLLEKVRSIKTPDLSYSLMEPNRSKQILM